MNSVLAKRWLRLRAYDHTMPIRLRDLIRLNRAQAARMDPQRGNFFVACITAIRGSLCMRYLRSSLTRSQEYLRFPIWRLLLS